MRTARAAVLASLILSFLLLGLAMASSQMTFSEFSHYRAAEWVKLAVVYTIVLGLCAWPWLRAYALASIEGQKVRVVGFSLAAVALCALFYVPISTAPTEGIGYYILICLLLVWLAYPISRVLASPNT